MPSIFGAKIEVWKHEMVHTFHFWSFSMVFEIENPFSFSISSKKVA